MHRTICKRMKGKTMDADYTNTRQLPRLHTRTSHSQRKDCICGAQTHKKSVGTNDYENYYNMTHANSNVHMVIHDKAEYESSKIASTHLFFIYLFRQNIK